jgi:NADPH2:quinone reductase
VIYPKGPFDETGKKDLAKMFKVACGPDGANVIYDPIGGDYSEAALRAVARNGRHLIIGFTAGVSRIPTNLPLLKSCQIIGVFYDAFTKLEPVDNAMNCQELLTHYASKKIKPAISGRFALKDGSMALQKLADRDAMGKLVVIVG